ncbi:peptidyl-alpha-hydroxyglycine alpha-amidating lyase family protein [Chloroflexota bacterium]
MKGDIQRMVYGTGKYRYELIDNWAKLPEGWTFIDVCGIDVDSQDRVYVLDRGPHPIMVFDRDGNLLTSWGEDYFARAHGSCFGPDGSFYCTDDIHHTVSKFSPKGELLTVLGNKDQPSDTGYVQLPSVFDSLDTIKQSAPPFNRPTGVSVSTSGETYVSDGYGNARVHKFSPDGKLLLSWGEPGKGRGQFRLPHAVWVDKQDRVWVPDRENNRIQIFNAQGELLTQWTDVARPTDVFIDDKETVYISELTRRVSIFTIDGKLLSRWDSRDEEQETALFVAPHTIAADSRGDLYVGEVSMSFAKFNRGPQTMHKFALVK